MEPLPGDRVRPRDRVLVLGYPGSWFTATALRVYVITKTYKAVKDGKRRIEKDARVDVVYPDGYKNDLRSDEVEPLKPCNRITICDEPDNSHHGPGALDHAFERGICAPIVISFPDEKTIRIFKRPAPSAPLEEVVRELADGSPAGFLICARSADDARSVFIVRVDRITPELEEIYKEAGYDLQAIKAVVVESEEP